MYAVCILRPLTSLFPLRYTAKVYYCYLYDLFELHLVAIDRFETIFCFNMAPYVWQGPLKKTGVIDVFKQKLLAPSLGSEFSDLDLVEALKSPNADALFRDLAVTS